MLKASNAAGSWSKPLLIRAAKGWIDPCPFWDDDGNAYLVHAWANSRSDIKSIITINRMSADGTKLLDDGKMVFDGRVAHPTIEGPKLYKRNGYYYIFAPASGVSTGWQTVLRARNIYGPYEDRIVMDRGHTEICEFSYSFDGKRFEKLGDKFKAQPGMWIGAKVGLFSLGPRGARVYGFADYDWFRFQ